MKRPAAVAVFVVCALVGIASHALAQGARDGKLIITVVDPQQGVLPDASVTLVGLEDATKAKTIAPVKANDKGIATIEGLTPGRYTIQGVFPGLETGWLRDIRVKSGDNKHVLVLPLRTMNETVEVGRDRQTQSSDRSVTFGSALTREQIDALSDDPDEMKRQLLQIAGSDATIRVDSFEGADLPPKAMIKSIHITRDQFAAESHAAGFGFVDIVTQPGVGPLRASVRSSFQTSALDGSNPLVQARGPAQSRNGGGTLGGTLIKDKADFSVSLNAFNNYSTPVLNTGLDANGNTKAVNLGIRQPSNNVGASGVFSWAITKDQTMKVFFNRGTSHFDNQGLGTNDNIGRQFSTNSGNWSLRVQEAGPLGRRFFTNTRFQILGSNSEAHSALEAPTILFLNELTNQGGAQRRGGTHTKNFTVNSDLDYVRGRNSWRAGIQVDGTRYRTNSFSNYLGTYTFVDKAAFDAGTPRSYTIRLGDPNIDYWNLALGLYLQDDLRLRKNLVLSYGVRYEAQTHVPDGLNLAPRAGLTWSPFKSGKTSLRASWGYFYDWLSTGTYQQTLSIDGFHQQQINLNNPTYPDPGPIGSAAPSDRYLLADNLPMAYNQRLSFSGSQTLSRRFNANVSYAHTYNYNMLVGENLNAPFAGVRPDARFANVIRAVPDARATTHSLSGGLSLNLSPMSPTSAGPAQAAMMGEGIRIVSIGGGGTSAGPWFQWRRGLYVSGSYYYRKNENDTDGAFAVPATGNLGLEWGPASFDTRHNGNFSISSSAFRNFSANISFNWSSAPAITIRTGTDDNGDLIFNDRPVGVGRNSVRTVGQWGSYAFFSYSIGLGKKTVAPPTGVGITMVNGVMSAATMSMPSQPRYRLSIGANVENLLNTANYSGFSGVITSQYYLKPTSVYGVRRVTFNVGLSF
jgi:hypothetical protein